MKHAIIAWSRAIATHRKALELVLEEIFALLELAMDQTTLAPALQTAVRRLLRPAESALRRLLIIMARDVSVKLPPSRPMQKGLTIVRSGQKSPRFQLYDSRIRVRPVPEDPRDARRGPCLHVFLPRGPLVPVFAKPKPARTGANLLRRLEALTTALETLPRQAQRMALWQLRRAANAKAKTMAVVKFTSPLRPGPPPGHQKRPQHAVDHLLAACHGLAHEVLYGNTS